MRARSLLLLAGAVALVAASQVAEAQGGARQTKAADPKASQRTEFAWLDRMSRELADGGQYAEAIALIQRALPLAENIHGAQSQTVANVLMRLAEMHRQYGNLGDSEALLHRALSIREKALGPEHAALGDTFNALGLVGLLQGRLTEAETFFKRSLDIRQKAYGSEHAAVGQSMNNLAWLYERQGRLLDAEPLARKALAVREKALGAGHKNVAFSLTNLAWILIAQGKLGEARELMTRALAIREKELGPDHPETITTINNMALLHIRAGRLGEAEALLERTRGAREKQFGPMHPEMRSTYGYLALLNRERGKLGEAEAFRRRILEINEKSYGPDHISTVSSAGDLAVNLHSQGKNEEAEALFKRALAGRERILGPEHPGVGRSFMAVGEFYRELGRHDEAEAYFKRALAVPKADIKQVSVVFATNRKFDAAKSRSFGGERSEQLAFGTAVMLAGREEVAERAERRATAGGQLDQSGAPLTSERRLAIRTVASGSGEAHLAGELKARIGEGRVPPRDALVFVHGYNVAFDDAAKRAAQIAFDLDFQGLMMLYSWPSSARLLGYGYDRDSADIATSHLAEFLQTASRLLPDTRIHLLAHSLGNMVMLGALEKLALATRGGPRPNIGEIVLAHPDVDRDRMRQLIRALDGVGAGKTLYMSEDDKAMWVSKLIRGVARAGGEPVVMKGIDTIDVTGLASSIWSTNHSTFASNPVAFGDISRLVTWSRRPVDKRTTLFETAAAEGGSYWRYRPPAAPKR